MKKYKTTILDEATFLAMKGHQFKSKRTGIKNSEWSFDNSPELEKIRKQFWSGNMVVSLNKWLMIRQQVKFNQMSQDIEKEAPKLSINKYFYVNKEHMSIMEATLGSSIAHKNRFREGNFFLTKPEAVGYLNSLNKK